MDPDGPVCRRHAGLSHLPVDDDFTGGLYLNASIHIAAYIKIAGNPERSLKLVQIPVHDLLLMNAELVVFDVQNPVHTGHKRLSAPADDGILPLGHTSLGGLRTGNSLSRNIHAVRPLPRGPDQTDDRSLPDGLQLGVLFKIHLAPVLHLHAHIPAPLEQLRHFAVLSRHGRLSPRHRKDAEIPKVKLSLDVFLQNAIANALVMHVSQELLQSYFIPAVLRPEQTRIGAHPVLGKEKTRLRLHRLQIAVQRRFVSGPAYLL